MVVTRSGTLIEMLARQTGPGRSALLTSRTAAGAEILLVDGAVVDAWCPSTPSADLVEQVRRDRDIPYRAQDAARLLGTALDAVDDVGLSMARSEAVLDTVRELALAPHRHRWRARRARRPVPPPQVRLPVRPVIAEIGRRGAALAQLAALLDPDSAVVRPARIPALRARVRPDQWVLLTACGTPTTPRELAHDVGDSVFRTTCRVAELIRLGLMDRADRSSTVGHQRPMLESTQVRVP